MSLLRFLSDEVGIFRGFPANDLVELAQVLVERRYKKGSAIFFEGDPADELYIVHSGCVKLFRVDAGREVLLSLWGRGEHVGEFDLLRDEALRTSCAEALEPAVLYVWRRSDFEGLLNRSHHLASRFLACELERLRSACDRIQDLTLYDVRTRTQKLLLYLSKMHGTPSDDAIQIEVKLTHQHLADMVGTSRESVTKVLSELKEDGVIQIAGRRIIVRDTGRRVAGGMGGQ